MTWQRITENQIEHNGYVIAKHCSRIAGVFIYHCHAPNGAHILSGGGATAEEFQQFCEQHERERLGKSAA